MNKQSESAMYGDSPGSDEHERFRNLPPAFAMVCLEDGTSSSEWNALESHLDGCALCRKELEDLLQLLDDTYTGTLEAERESPVPDLAYLPPWSTSERPHELIAIVHTVSATIRQIFIQFTEMLISAMRLPEQAGGFRSEKQGAENNSSEKDQALPEEYTYQIRGSSPDDMVVAVDFTLTDSDRQLYRVKVTVVDQDQDPFSQDGHRVTVHYEAQTVDAITDMSGCASFHDLPYTALPELQITVNLRSAT
jgi:hypothetical protein